MVMKITGDPVSAGTEKNEVRERAEQIKENREMGGFSYWLSFGLPNRKPRKSTIGGKINNKVFQRIRRFYFYAIRRLVRFDRGFGVHAVLVSSKHSEPELKILLLRIDRLRRIGYRTRLVLY